MRKLLAALLVFTFGSPLVNATTLVAFRDAKSVVLAADSKILPFKSSLNRPLNPSFLAVANIL
jgi:hypothetical protein